VKYPARVFRIFPEMTRFKNSRALGIHREDKRMIVGIENGEYRQNERMVIGRENEEDC
jgi:hypothetical protein